MTVGEVAVVTSNLKQTATTTSISQSTRGVRDRPKKSEFSPNSKDNTSSVSEQFRAWLLSENVFASTTEVINFIKNKWLEKYKYEIQKNKFDYVNTLIVLIVLYHQL